MKDYNISETINTDDVKIVLTGFEKEVETTNNPEFYDKTEFQVLIKEIHRNNQGWHCFETSNRFLDMNNKYLQSYYLKQKNNLQDQLIDDYSDRIEILPIDTTGNPSIAIKDEYQFEYENIFYKDACHTIKPKKEVEKNG